VSRYTILVRPEDGAYVVDVPALPGCHSIGDTLAEAIANAQEAMALYLDVLRERGEPIPEETEPVVLSERGPPHKNCADRRAGQGACGGKTISEQR
jgi:predicted RNase H-like HicB family nuclease